MVALPNLETPIPTEPPWPGQIDRPTVVLADVSSRLEYRLVENWARRHAHGSVEIIRIPSSRRRRSHRGIGPQLEPRLSRRDNPLVLPVRVIWSAPDRDGARTVKLADLAKLGDPRDPDPLREYAILATSPDRVAVIYGEPAGGEALREAWRAADDGDSLGAFVARRAWLALERAERRQRGNRYKVPKFVHEEIFRRAAFKDGIAKLADAEKRTYDSVRRQAGRNLREIAASHSPFVIDIVAGMIHWLYRQGYGSLNYDAARLREIYQLSEDHPLVFLPAHKSQLDRLVLQYILWENDLPSNHTAGGINLNFFPIGPLLRRTGVFFIRRSFKGKPIYKFALQSYLDYLLSNHFPLEWYLEGGRSRSGKLLPPKFGMLTYVVESLRRGSADDVILVPIAIAYDQIQDVGDYAREQRGEAKESESLTWLFKAVRSLRQRYGNVHIRFGEPVSVATELAGQTDGELGVSKLAFEVMVRINRAMPITPTAAVTLALLGHHRQAMTVDQIVESLTDFAKYAIHRHLPRTERIEFEGHGQVQEVLDRLVEHNIVSRFEGGSDVVYRVSDDQYLSAAYYRNTIVHYFVPGAIAELALVKMVQEHSHSVDDFWEEVLALRDLLKFEFFFSEKNEFKEEVGQELSHRMPGWEDLIRRSHESVIEVIGTLKPIQSSWAIRPFLEAYYVVAESLASWPVEETFNEKGFLSKALEIGMQYRLQGRISAEEAVSQVLFKSALSLAANRQLLTGVEADSLLPRRRTAFASEIGAVLERIDDLEAME